MDNKKFIYVDVLLALPDHSVTDTNVLNDIGLVTTNFNTTDETRIKLFRKPKYGYEIFALYPCGFTNMDVTIISLKKSYFGRLFEYLNEKRKEYKETLNR